MKNIFLDLVVFLLLTLSGIALSANDGYRISGVISYGSANWKAIIELPDSEQQLVEVGDTIGEAEVVNISKEAVTLQFPGRENRLQLGQGDYIPLTGDAIHLDERYSRPQKEGGMVAGDFRKLVNKKLNPKQLSGIWGLETLDQLSVSARIVSYSSIDDPGDRNPMVSLESGVNLLQDVIVKGKSFRINVEGDESVLDFYLMPRQIE